jgi:hypothetical protein
VREAFLKERFALGLRLQFSPEAHCRPLEAVARPNRRQKREHDD